MPTTYTDAVTSPGRLTVDGSTVTIDNGERRVGIPFSDDSIGEFGRFLIDCATTTRPDGDADEWHGFEEWDCGAAAVECYFAENGYCEINAGSEGVIVSFFPTVEQSISLGEQLVAGTGSADA